MNPLRYISPAFWTRKVAVAVGVPPSTARWLGLGVAVVGLDFIELLSEGGEIWDAGAEWSEQTPGNVPVEGGAELGTAEDYATECAEDGEEAMEDEADAMGLVGSTAIEMDEDTLRECFTYGCLAKAAYIDDSATIEQFLSECYPDSTGEPISSSIEDTPTVLRWNNPLIGAVITTDTEVVVFKRAEDELVFAFRGTETSLKAGLVEDATTDIFAVKTPLSNMLGMQGRFPDSVQVHKGFLTSFNDCIGTDPGQLRLCEFVDELRPRRVVCCGHSLGGALATLGAFWVSQCGFPEVQEIKCYAFASPRVGNLSFSGLFDQAVPDCYRFTHKSDVVPAVPPVGWYKHIGQPVMLFEPADDCYGIYGTGEAEGDLEAEQPPEEEGEAGYKAVLRDRSLFGGPYLGVGDHSMAGYLRALADVVNNASGEETVTLPEDPAGDLKEARMLTGLIGILGLGGVGAAGAVAAARTLPATTPVDKREAASTIMSQLHLNQAAAAQAQQVRMPGPAELADAEHALKLRAANVKFMSQALSEDIPVGWRLATCADVLEHMCQAWHAITGGFSRAALLADGQFSLFELPLVHDTIGTLETNPNGSKDWSEVEQRLLIHSDELQPRTMRQLSKGVRSLIDQEKDAALQVVLCGHHGFLLSKIGVGGTDPYTPDIPWQHAHKGQTNIPHAARIDLILPGTSGSWVKLQDAYVRTSLKAMFAKRSIKFAEFPNDSKSLEWRLLVRDCDVERAAEQLHKLAASSGKKAAPDAVRELCQRAGSHALGDEKWKLVECNKEVANGWRPATCWEVCCLLPYSCATTLAKAEVVQLLDGHSTMLKCEDLGSRLCAMKLTVEHPRQPFTHKLLVQAPEKLAHDQHLLARAVLSAIQHSQGSLVMAAAPNVAGLQGWLVLAPSCGMSALGGFNVVDYDAVDRGVAQSSSVKGLLRLMLINTVYGLSTAHKRALLQGGRISLPGNLTNVDYTLKKWFIKLKLTRDSDIRPDQDQTGTHTLLLRPTAASVANGREDWSKWFN